MFNNSNEGWNNQQAHPIKIKTKLAWERAVEKIANVTNKIANITNNQLRELASSTNNKIDRLENDANKRFQKIEERFKRLEKNFDKIENQIAQALNTEIQFETPTHIAYNRNGHVEATIFPCSNQVSLTFSF